MRSIIILFFASILSGCSSYTYLSSDIIPARILRPMASGACDGSRFVTNSINNVVVPNREVELQAHPYMHVTPAGQVEKGFNCSDTARIYVPAQPRSRYYRYR